MRPLDRHLRELRVDCVYFRLHFRLACVYFRLPCVHTRLHSRRKLMLYLGNLLIIDDSLTIGQEGLAQNSSRHCVLGVDVVGWNVDVVGWNDDVVG